MQLADDTVAELEAMRAENIHLSSEAVMHDGELQACKQALADLTTALEVMRSQAPDRLTLYHTIVCSLDVLRVCPANLVRLRAHQS